LQERRKAGEIMPELPEVQTVINGLQEKVIGKNIVQIREHRAGTLIWHTEEHDLGSIKAISRRGKYIIFITDMDYKIVIHLRMTGKLIYEENYNYKTDHTRAEIYFTDRTKLVFNDIRTFGKMEIYSINDQVSALEALGVEPLSDDLNLNYLKEKLKTKEAPIKNILLDQRIIAGLGNIYACEILYRAGVKPQRKGRSLKIKDIENVINHTKEVLMEALEHNGTTISDYRNVDDKTGEFQNFLRVYGKEKCNCGNDILRIKQAGRSTYYCPKCQRK
jgi:formamidopyrimidine-DNA glycosylase